MNMKDVREIVIQMYNLIDTIQNFVKSIAYKYEEVGTTSLNDQKRVVLEMEK